MSLSEENSEKLLGYKRRKKESNEKEVFLYDSYGKNEVLSEKKSFKKINEFDDYLNTLKNPYFILNGIINDLNNFENRRFFFYSEDVSKIYQKEDDSEILNDYKKYLYDYLDIDSKPIKINYPMTLDKLLLGPTFFFDLPSENCPKFYKGKDGHLSKLLMFIDSSDYNLFHLYMRKNSGTTLYLMKQMERKNEGFIYFDLRKLNAIILNNNNNKTKFKDEFKKFIFYSLFNVKSSYIDINIGYKQIEKYYFFILNQIDLNLYNININNFINNIFDLFIKLYEKEILSYLKLEKEREYQTLIMIIDHYNYEIEYDKINKILNRKENNERLKFIIVHSFNSKKEINEFFENLNNNNYVQYKGRKGYIKGIEVIKNKTIIGYYEEMYAFDEKNFEDEDLKILKIYKDELLDNFGLVNPDYFYKFIKYMKDKQKNEKNNKILAGFLKKISQEIELIIRNFYDNKLEDQYFFLSKYYKEYLEKKNNEQYIKQIDLIKKNIPLNYFIIKFSNDTKDIVDIIPSCNLVKRIITKMSKNFSSVIYQSEFYTNLQNQGEKGNILQEAVEENLRKDPSILLNYTEKTYIFEMEYLIPTSTYNNGIKEDPVIEYNKLINRKANNNNENIVSFMSEKEKDDMNIFSQRILNENKKYENIIIFQKDAYGKNYDFAIIKLIENSFFVLFVFQVTVSRETKKFKSVNILLEKDIAYLIDKFEYYLKGYKSKGFYLIYVLDNQENEDINLLNNKKDIKKNTNVEYKKGLNSKIKDIVYLLYFDRKYLKFLSEDGKIIKEMTFEKEKEKEKGKENEKENEKEKEKEYIKFIYSDINHYFLDNYTKKFFDKVIDIFMIKVGKFFVDNYDFSNIIGNFLIITKFSDKSATAIININGQKFHSIQANNAIMKQIQNVTVFEERESYYFEIINPDNINTISLFSEISIY